MGFSRRTYNCGELRLAQVGQEVTVTGWANKVRDLGGVAFVDLRDRTGIVQLTLDPTKFSSLSDLRTEACLSLTGRVCERAAGTKNPRLATGEIEIVVDRFELLGASKPLPFPVSDEEQMQSVNEELRVRYRYLDLRRPSMYRRMAIRAKLINRMRSHLENLDFVEIETPIITKSTPEGARDYLVPYRLSPGSWYALPQSPQQYKQMLMVAGIERYFQVARCFRDESARADRQPEFTQLDIEMSFVEQEEVLNLAEELCRSSINEVIETFGLDKEPITGAFDRITYDEAMNFYGCDKPDLRFALPLFDVTGILGGTTFGVFESAIQAGGVIRGALYPGGGSLSRREIGVLEEFCRELGAKGMASLIVPAEGELARGSVAKFLSESEIAQVVAAANAGPGDLICLVAGEFDMSCSVLYRLRLEIGDRLKLRDPRILKYIWVTDFPLVDWDADAGRWSATHHPFTSPREEDLSTLEANPGAARANAYDMVCNGYECAGGSIRIHRADVQARMFDLLGISPETQQSQFGHLLEAFSYGAPPHGGIAFGLDRAIMILTDTENIREVIAFPKIGNGTDPLMDSPSTIGAHQWAELGLRLAPV
jgi:aspartyl-tRNA synthetase